MRQVLLTSASIGSFALLVALNSLVVPAADVTTKSLTVTAPPATIPYPRSTIPAAGKTIHWKKTVLDEKFRGEGVAVGDFNHDGKMDIAVGSVYYAAPDWKMHVIGEKAEEFDPHNYSDAFMCYADDLNHDGWTDLIVIGFPGKETFWYENPKGAPGPWKRHLITPVSNNESPAYVDIDGSGQRSLVMGIAPDSTHSDGKDRQMAILRPDKDDPTKPWIAQPISTKGGTGDDEVLTRPRRRFDSRQRSQRRRRDRWLVGIAGRQKPRRLVDVSSREVRQGLLAHDRVRFQRRRPRRHPHRKCHDYGIWLHEQTVDGWKTREIDKSFSETHSVVLADIAGDGLPGFVTGKRWWAHGPTGDPGAGEPAVLYWFELVRKNGQAEFIRHEIDHHSGVGTQFEVADVNGDGLLDVAIGNKHGVFLFEQVRD